MDLPEAFAVLGFAFYLQPCLLPLMAEMPPGAAGVRLMTAATRTVVLGVSTVVRVGSNLKIHFVIDNNDSVALVSALLHSMLIHVPSNPRTPHIRALLYHPLQSSGTRQGCQN